MTQSTQHRTRPSSHRVEPSAAAPAALLLHGLSGSPVEMHHLSRCLRHSGFEVHIPAIPGYGFGTRDDPFDTGTWEQWAAYASGALDILSQRHERIYLAGLCIGAVLALRLAMERPQLVRAMSLISITLEQDGWATPWYRKMVRLACHTPLRRRAKLYERFPYGLKNERLRERIARAMHTEGSSAAGAEFLPLSGMHQAYRLIAAVQRDIARVTTPSLVLHAIDDDVASTRSAEFVARNIRTPDVRTVLYRDSYHILTMDNDRDAVADETIGFFSKYGAHPTAPEPQQHPVEIKRAPSLAADETVPDVNTWMPGMGEGSDFGSSGRQERLQLGLPTGVVEA
jgi:carboxylesterase